MEWYEHIKHADDCFLGFSSLYTSAERRIEGLVRIGQRIRSESDPNGDVVRLGRTVQKIENALHDYHGQFEEHFRLSLEALKTSR